MKSTVYQVFLDEKFKGAFTQKANAIVRIAGLIREGHPGASTIYLDALEKGTDVEETILTIDLNEKG